MIFRLTFQSKIVAEKKDSRDRDVPVGRQDYTGYEIEPGIRVLIKQGNLWKEVNTSYYSVSYINNLNKGKATILITGNGTDAAGSKTASFTISYMSMSLFEILFGK